ncbi:MAG: helix-turn-helix domain-containing protein, partial [Planctomycetota bacterium]
AVIAGFRRLRESLAEDHGAYRTLAELHLLLDAIAPRPEHAPVSSQAELVAQASALMEAQLDRGLGILDLARLLRVDRSTLFKAFQQERGCSPQEHLAAVRITRAQELLRDGQHSCRTIAQAVGFATDKSLSRAFRRLVGCSPEQWRQSRSKD